MYFRNHGFMKKSYLLLGIMMVLLLSSCADSRTEQLKTILKEQKDSEEIYLGELTDFEWDKVYFIPPYTSREQIEKSIGFQSDAIKDNMSDDGDVYVIFTEQDTLAGQVYGRPEKLGFDFEFETWQECLNQKESIFSVRTVDGIKSYRWKAQKNPETESASDIENEHEKRIEGIDVLSESDGNKDGIETVQAILRKTKDELYGTKDGWQEEDGSTDEEKEFLMTASSTDKYRACSMGGVHSANLYLYDNDTGALAILQPSVQEVNVETIEWMDDTTVAAGYHASPSAGILAIYDVVEKKPLFEKICGGAYTWADGISSVVYCDVQSYTGSVIGKTALYNYKGDILYRTKENEIVHSMAENNGGDLAVLIYEMKDPNEETRKEKLLFLKKKNEGGKYKAVKEKEIKDFNYGLQWNGRKSIMYYNDKHKKRKVTV